MIALLERYQVPYQALHQSTATQSIEATAQARGIESRNMLKCVLLRNLDDQLFLACTRGTQRVIPQVVRSHFDCRRVTCVAPNDVEFRCGLALGTLNPISLDNRIVRVFDSTIPLKESVTISSGDPLLGIKLRFSDLQKVCQHLNLDVLVAPVN